METPIIQIQDFLKKLRMNPKIIPSVFVYDVFEMFVKLNLILRMFKDV